MDLRYPQIIDIAVNRDARGSHRKFFGQSPIDIAVPDLEVKESFMTVSDLNVVRGLAVQFPGQSKLIQVITGAVRGNIVCCDPLLPEFGKSIEFYLEEESPKKIFVPGTWAQGYRALKDSTRVLYLANELYSNVSVGINPFSPDLKLNWGEGFTSDMAIMAERDRNAPSFGEVKDKLVELSMKSTEGEK